MARRKPTTDEANRQRLAECRMHDFERQSESDDAGDWRCRACGGWVTTSEQYWYRTGLHDGQKLRGQR